MFSRGDVCLARLREERPHLMSLFTRHARGARRVWARVPVRSARRLAGARSLARSARSLAVGSAFVCVGARRGAAALVVECAGFPPYACPVVDGKVPVGAAGVKTARGRRARRRRAAPPPRPAFGRSTAVRLAAISLRAVVGEARMIYNSNGMEWNGTDWNGMKWNGLERSAAKEWNGRQSTAWRSSAKPISRRHIHFAHRDAIQRCH